MADIGRCDRWTSGVAAPAKRRRTGISRLLALVVVLGAAAASQPMAFAAAPPPAQTTVVVELSKPYGFETRSDCTELMPPAYSTECNGDADGDGAVSGNAYAQTN